MGLSQTLTYYRPKGKYLFVVVTSTTLAIIWVMLSGWVLAKIFEKDLLYTAWLYTAMPITFIYGFILLLAMGIISLLFYETREQQSILARKEEAEKMAREAELFKLRQQLQPHFLFNSLNSINALIAIRPDEARQMVTKLSDFLRGTLKKEDKQWISVDEEIQYLRLYLDIEKVRFRHRLSTEITISEAATGLQIPPMILQPIVENAIKFGLYDTTEAITITIDAWQEDGVLMIAVANPFDSSLNPASKSGTGFGLSSIQRRLYLLFGRQDLLSTTSEGDLFTATIKVPQPQ